MCEVIGSVVLGAFIGGGATKISWRRPLRVVIREGIRTQRKLTELGVSIREEAKQLVAEARGELDQSSHARTLILTPICRDFLR
jgi:hypothetical protein